MEALFYVIPVILIAVAGYGALRMIGRFRRIDATWSRGLTAEARCLRSYVSTSGGGDTMVHTTLHHVYEFTTREGRAVRFDEPNGPSTVVEGDVVTVHYLPDRPEQATARPPAPGRLAAETGCVLGCLGVFAACCAGFMIVAHLIFSQLREVLP
ncbi:DUF3592 domain-containing protein [Streptomyces shenzhenensis]|uniref:DUF3592 domain-containing protein n=1 Tax=Streptomyces shenzhenensis TaxID=943815 RepID=UPI00380774D7